MTESRFGREQLGGLADAVEATVADLVGRDAIRRMWDGDHTLWAPDPTEISDRLGWLHVAREVLADRDRLEGFADACHADGLRHVVVMGMGGSSLFPEVIARTFTTPDGRLHLHVIDTTDPQAVARVEAVAPLGETLFVASSKSGSTIETRSHLAHFWDRVGNPAQFAVVTDPGSELGDLARSRGFREVFENRSDIGGRYSALSYFGLVPAALAGAPWTDLVASAEALAPSLGPDAEPAAHPGLRLGAVLGAAVKAGRDKLTLVIDESVATFGLWLEQLIAESTGKHGTGVVPVAGEALGPVDVYGDDRLFVSIGTPPGDEVVGLDVLGDMGHPVVRLGLGDPTDLGAQVLLWEVATAVCGAVLGINPFDQPNVAEAKAATNDVLAGGPPDLPLGSLDDLLAKVQPGDYVAIQAYVDPGDERLADLEEARLRIRDEHKVATTFGLGPRFLHSTGQLHKGGPPTGVFVQVVGDDVADSHVPDQPFTFGELKHAQADGDLLTLREHGLRAERVRAQDLIDHG